MTYRDWHEITKALLTHGEVAKLLKSKMACPETKVYVKWVRENIRARPALFDDYPKGHGIVTVSPHVSGSFGVGDCGGGER